MSVNNDISALLNPASSDNARSQASQRMQQRSDDRNNQHKDSTIFKTVGSGLIGAAVAKTLFGNRGS